LIDRSIYAAATEHEHGICGHAEYCLVDARYVERKPEKLSYIEGACIADSPVNGMLALEDGKFAAGERILVLGGSGACGGSIIQTAKAKGASYIAATSTAGDLVASLGADKVIDYTCGALLCSDNHAWGPCMMFV
jgi:2-methylene-furan-3-one reductase